MDLGHKSLQCHSAILNLVHIFQNQMLEIYAYDINWSEFI